MSGFSHLSSSFVERGTIPESLNSSIDCIDASKDRRSLVTSAASHASLHRHIFSPYQSPNYSPTISLAPSEPSQIAPDEIEKGSFRVLFDRFGTLTALMKRSADGLDALHRIVENRAEAEHNFGKAVEDLAVMLQRAPDSEAESLKAGRSAAEAFLASLAAAYKKWKTTLEVSSIIFSFNF